VVLLVSQVHPDHASSLKPTNLFTVNQVKAVHQVHKVKWVCPDVLVKMDEMAKMVNQVKLGQEVQQVPQVKMDAMVKMVKLDPQASPDKLKDALLIVAVSKFTKIMTKSLNTILITPTAI
jgi:hypothetical protein